MRSSALMQPQWTVTSAMSRSGTGDRRREIGMKKLLGVLVLAGLITAVIVLNRVRARDKGVGMLHVAPPAALAVTVAHPEWQSIVRTVQAPGEVEAILEVDISSEIAAKIEEMPVEEGDVVKAGDLLCRLNDREFRAMVESGEANVAKLEAAIRQTEADLEKCRRDLERQERLLTQNATSQIELADQRTALVRTQAGVDMRKQELLDAQAMLRRARESLEKTIISSPIDGVIAKRHAKPGEVVITGTMNNPGTVIMVITDLSRMRVRARVDETDVPLVKEGQPVRIYLPSDPRKPFPGTVTQVAAKGSKPVGRDVVTFETLVLVESNDPAIKPAMTANVEIEVASKERALTVPVQAVVQRKRKDVPEALQKAFEARQPAAVSGSRLPKAQYLKLIFTMQDGKAVPHLVETGIADESRVEILEGLAEGAQVVVGPYRSLDQLKDGALVKLEEANKDKPGAETEAAKLAQTSQPAGEEVAKAP